MEKKKQDQKGNNNQKKGLKLFYIADYLMKETYTEGDFYKGVFVGEIKEYLESQGITVEEHAISRDIKLLRDEFGMDILGGGGRGRPFYLASRYIDFEDLATIGECIGTSKFISEKEAKDLIDRLKKLCSTEQGKELEKDYFVVERPRLAPKNMRNTLSAIRTAINSDQRLRFHYTKRNFRNLDETIERQNGKYYYVSPHRVVLSEGNHYLICYDEIAHQIRPYRIDRMKDLETLPGPREGEQKFIELGISDYARQTFGMFIGGKSQRITIQFDMSLLDAVVERFGNSQATIYKKVDDKYFTLETPIVKSENFYGWVCGLGAKAVIVEPDAIVKGFKDYLKKIEEQYK